MASTHSNLFWGGTEERNREDTPNELIEEYTREWRNIICSDSNTEGGIRLSSLGVIHEIRKKVGDSINSELNKLEVSMGYVNTTLCTPPRMHTTTYAPFLIHSLCIIYIIYTPSAY